MNDAATPTATTDPQQAPQTYQLLIEVEESVRVRIGRFGAFNFLAGRYCYTGSAKRNFDARVRRHLSPTKTLRWHIDYLLAAPGVRIIEVLHHTLPECQVNQATAGEIPVSGFGASDCHAVCGSHLKQVG